MKSRLTIAALLSLTAASAMAAGSDDHSHDELTIGRAGQGPGEFSYPTNLSQAADTLRVTDWRNGRLQMLSLDGEPLGTVRLQPTPWPPVAPAEMVRRSAPAPPFRTLASTSTAASPPLPPLPVTPALPK